MNYRDKNRFVQIGLKIAYYRKLSGISQEELAEKIGRSTGYIGQIEAPKIVKPLSLQTLFYIADELNIPPYKFLEFDTFDLDK